MAATMPAPPTSGAIYRTPPAFAVTTDLPVVPAGDELALPPGPNFLAEAERLMPPVDDSGWDSLIAAWMEGASAGEHTLAHCLLPKEIDTALWRQQAKSKAEKQRAIAIKKARKMLEDEADAGRAGPRNELLTGLYRRALYDGGGFRMPLALKRGEANPVLMPGHLLGDTPRSTRPGPRAASVMVIGLHPREDEVQIGRHFIGQATEPLRRAFEDLGDPAVSGWYVTCLVKHFNCDPRTATIPTAWIKDGLPLLWSELRTVRPDFVLCLGAKVAAALLGRPVTVSTMRGKVEELTIPGFGGAPDKVARLQVMLDPGAGVHDPRQYDDLLASLREFLEVVRGGEPQRMRIPHRKHVNLYRERDLAAVVDRILAEPDNATIAMDCEWEGKWYEPEGSWLRTIQFSHRAGEGYVIVLRHEGGKPAFKPSVDAALPHLKRLCKSTPGRPVRVGGHFFRADLPWLLRYGLDLSDEFAEAVDPEATRYAGGFDTGDMLHALYEDSKSFGLEIWANKLLGVPRYDLAVDEAVKKFLKDRNLKKWQLTGYGGLADDDLHSDAPGGHNYAAFDPDVTRELFEVLNGVGGRPGLLDRDAYGISSRKAFWVSQGAALGFLEMERVGIRIDRDKLDVLSLAFLTVRNRMLEKLREDLNWPDFNIQSVYQVREALFGAEYNGKPRTAAGDPDRVRPPGALTLGLTPIKSSGKKGAKDWARIVEDDEEDMYDPSTDSEILGMLAHAYDNATVRLIQDLRFVCQVLKAPLRVPLADAAGRWVRDADGHFAYDMEKGLPRYIASDGRVYTTFYPLKTGRASCRNPPLQNFSKQREDDYARILGDLRPCPMRAVLAAGPGKVLVEADFKLAEVAGLAWMSNDPAMIEDARLSMLPKSHPEYVDLHVKTAIEFFKLDCEPTKKGLEKLGKPGLRVAAKNVRFGVPYGRGAVSIHRQCKEKGADVTVEEVQFLLDQFHTKYAVATAYLNSLAARVVEPGWIMGAYGRARRFGATPDRKVRKSLERQAYNVPIQNLVADNMRLVMRELVKLKRERGYTDEFAMILNAHDALVFEVRPDCLAWFAGEGGILSEYMSRRVPICPTDLDGNPIPGRGPYYFDIDTEVFVNWGEPISAEAALELGVPEEFL